ncbi:uncharacterized protein LOC116712168 [Xiphophorus hellerii]|uniref:uncharacterized protein LOC116712168 n=1 Tax=Xiphophorus hellerii TaxID=8084 RepID=UPI0013B3A99A|nr:uncharacterized protein LOC116712168 [Xiphophorus hellerii]
MMFVVSADLLPIRSVSTVHTAVSRRVPPRPAVLWASPPSGLHRRPAVAPQSADGSASPAAGAGDGRRRLRPAWRRSDSPVCPLGVQAAAVFTLSCCSVLTLVLEEDGTVVDSEEFFQALPSGAPLMVLDEGQTWFQSKVRPRKGRGPPPPADGGEPPGQSGLKVLVLPGRIAGTWREKIHREATSSQLEQGYTDCNTEGSGDLAPSGGSLRNCRPHCEQH